MFENVTEIEFAYLAGFIDGEGCFFIGLFNTKSAATGRMNPNYHTLITITNTDKGVIKWIINKFGGTKDNQSRPTRKSKIIRTIYKVCFTGNRLTNLTKRLLPYLIYKRPHAEVMLKMRSTFAEKRGKVFVSEEKKDFRYSCMRELRTLNTRFHGHPLKNL